ncbi:Uncharacterized protein GBIM_16826 [Gryllus bimaculatus]|nr:Uncharacterized protein GBIM_16826 [Gryllus bimaculatus]
MFVARRPQVAAQSAGALGARAVFWEKRWRRVVQRPDHSPSLPEPPLALPLPPPSAPVMPRERLNGRGERGAPHPGSSFGPEAVTFLWKSQLLWLLSHRALLIHQLVSIGRWTLSNFRQLCLLENAGDSVIIRREQDSRTSQEEVGTVQTEVAGVLDCAGNCKDVRGGKLGCGVCLNLITLRERVWPTWTPLKQYRSDCPRSDAPSSPRGCRRRLPGGALCSLEPSRCLSPATPRVAMLRHDKTRQPAAPRRATTTRHATPRHGNKPRDNTPRQATPRQDTTRRHSTATRHPTPRQQNMPRHAMTCQNNSRLPHLSYLIQTPRGAVRRGAARERVRAASLLLLAVGSARPPPPPPRTHQVYLSCFLTTGGLSAEEPVVKWAREKGYGFLPGCPAVPALRAIGRPSWYFVWKQRCAVVWVSRLNLAVALPSPRRSTTASARPPRCASSPGKEGDGRPRFAEAIRRSGFPPREIRTRALGGALGPGAWQRGPAASALRTRFLTNQLAPSQPQRVARRLGKANSVRLPVARECSHCIAKKRDEDKNRLILLSSRQLDSKTTSEFSQYRVQQTFNVGFAGWHANWKSTHFDWLPSSAQIPKSLGEPTPQEHLEKLQRVQSCMFWWSDQSVVQQTLCEVQVLMVERNVRQHPDVQRDLMDSNVRQNNSTSHRNLRDWLIYRDYMNGLEYVIEVLEHFERQYPSS